MSTRRSSSAVVASRKSPTKALDFFPTPPWAYRALVHEVLRANRFLGRIDPGRTVWEPACGAGHGAIPLSETHQVFGTDVHDWGYGQVRDLDFSFCSASDAPYPVDWVITNPPFTLAEMFATRGLAIARCGVALLLRLQWLEGIERHLRFFNALGDAKPELICPFAERVPMIEGVWDPEATTATAYCWIVWTKGPRHESDAYRLPEVFHIRPGMADIYTRLADEQLASRGEAARRLAAKKALAA